MSKNYGLKIPVRARMYARAYDCRNTTRKAHTTNTTTDTPPEKGGGKTYIYK